MSKHIEITKEMLGQARDYVPVREKAEWVERCADRCFDRLAITADGEDMPPMYAVNVGLKNRYLMTAFVKLYLGSRDLLTEVADEWLMTEEDYDRWAGSHVFGQVERWKRDNEARDKCFDLLADFKDLSKWFSTQINSLLTVQNDGVLRQTQHMAAQMKELPALLKQLKELQGGRSDGLQG